MTDPLISEFCNESNDKIMDFDDTELMTSNNNFDFQSFKEVNNDIEKNNGEFIGSYEDKIERLNNDKILIQNRLNNKIIELQTQIVKMKNQLEKSEMSKAEIEVAVTKVNKELRNCQRQYSLKSVEFEKSKFDLTNHFKALESEYINQISQLNSMHRMFQEQVTEEKRNHQKSQDTLHHQINQLTDKIKEKDEELSKRNSTQIQLESVSQEHELTISDLKQKIKDLEEAILRDRSVIQDQRTQLEILNLSESKLKTIIVELNAKNNHLESKNFEEKHELNDSRNYQNNLQSQVFDLQQGQIIHEKERQILVDKINGCNRRIKDLEESLNNQVRIATNYREQIKKLEVERELQDVSINETNEDLQSKVEELESKLQVQSRIIEEVNDEISSSRENESVAVSHLAKTLEELENYITESTGHFKSQNASPRYTKTHLSVPGAHCQSSPRATKIDIPGDSNKHSRDTEYRPATKNVMRNIKNTILNFQERINTLESDRLEHMDKLQSQDKEIKNLKSQIRRYAVQQKTLETENNEKQGEIDNLLCEISNLKTQSSAIRQDNGKNIANLKQTLHRATDEYQENIEIRDNYLQSIATMIKDALNNGISSIVDKGHESQGDSRRTVKLEPTVPVTNESQKIIESGTQTHFADNTHNKDNLQLSGNLVGTFRFMNENNLEGTGVIDDQYEKRTRYCPGNSSDRKLDYHQTNNNVDDKKKSSLKKANKKTDCKNDANGSYVDSAKSWPALREVISNELVSLLNRYDIQRAQCQQLISELSAKENIITRLLSNQNSNSAQPHPPPDSISRCQQTSIHEPVVANKSPNKLTAFSQNSVIVRSNSDAKKKPRTPLKSKLDNISTNVSNKKCFKSETQKPLQPTRKLSTNPCAHTNKKAITTSIKQPPNSIGSLIPLMSPTGAQKSDVNISSAQRPTAISPQSTQQVTSRCPEIVNHSQSPDDSCNIDSRLFPLFLGILLRLIHTTSKLKSMNDLVYFYKLCYCRSIDCSKLISINNDLEKVVQRPGSKVSGFKKKIPNCRRFKTAVHVVSVCHYISKKMLATKLFVPVDPNHINPFDFKDFLETILNIDSRTSSVIVDNITETFSQFCIFNNYQDLLIENERKPQKSNTIMASSSFFVLKEMTKNIDILKSTCASHIPLVKYNSKKKSYQMNLKTLMMKVSELIHIIDGQNTVIEMREEELMRLKEHISIKCDEKAKLMNLISGIKFQLKNDTLESDYKILTINKTKSYLSKIINLCESFIKDELFDFTMLMKEEELIYRSLKTIDCDDLIDYVRNGICVALTLCGYVKSIII